jgi:chromosome segregation protein
MSYEYARIPLNLGLNIVCGPNGAGKSSILLAISVVLGQAYTERGRKFSDMIRWGEDTARVTLTFDNKVKGGTRPIPSFNTDYLRLSRYLKKDGNYWFQANFKTITKSEVVDLLSELGINPDNMLIIMHQHMMMEFGATSAQQKLMMVEEAVGFRKYRENLFDAQDKLTQVLSEEESIANLLKNAEQTLDYWKGEYDRYLKRKDWLLKRDFLERELIWSRLIKQERIIAVLEGRNSRKKEEMDNKEWKINEITDILIELNEKLNEFSSKRSKHYNTLFMLEKERIGLEEKIETFQKILQNVQNQEKIDHIGFNVQMLLAEADSKDLFLKNLREKKPFEHAKLENIYSQMNNRSESIQILERRLGEYQTNVQLFKYEADKQEYEHEVLDKMINEQELKNSSLQDKTKRLDLLLTLQNQREPMLKIWGETVDIIKWEEARKKSLEKELDGVITLIPSMIEIKPIDDPVELTENVLSRLQSEVNSRNLIEEQIKKIHTDLQFLTSEEQGTILKIRIFENEISVLSKHHREVKTSLDEKRENPQIICDKCGSKLTSNQWLTHLKEIEDQIDTNEKQVSNIRIKLEDIQNQLDHMRNEQDELKQEERLLEKINPIITQLQRLHNDIVNSGKILRTNVEKEKEIIKNLADLEGTGSYVDPKQRMMEIQTEIHNLKNEIPQLKEEIANYAEIYINPQRERVSRANSAADKYKTIIPKIIENFKLYVIKIWKQNQTINEMKRENEEKASMTQSDLEKIERESRGITERAQDEKEKQVTLSIEKENIKNEINILNNELNEAQQELVQLQPLSEKMGMRIDTERNVSDITTDIKVTNAHLTLFKEIPEDVEKIYTNYLNLHNELKEKVIIVSENRARALQEVEERKKIWKKLLQALLDKVNPSFQEFLEKIGGTGTVKIVNTEDIETAGLDLIVGFKGVKPQILDSRTQSGGEKSSATMAFLLALQRHIKSPFRAVDEFDVHMDPRNREVISQMLLKEMEQEAESQYLAITPGQLLNINEEVQVITVQNTKGISEVKVVA